jgi:predicted  nucleic acid-binding Zn-ribbon protein
VSTRSALVALHDADMLLEEARAPDERRRCRALGLDLTGLAAVERTRAQLHAQLDPRWVRAYERARQRYGRAVVVVRERVCQGCHVTLPTSASAGADAITVCESCGRILIWC